MTYQSPTTGYVYDGTLSNNFEYKQTVCALYAEGSFTVGNLESSNSKKKRSKIPMATAMKVMVDDQEQMRCLPVVAKCRESPNCSRRL